MENKKTSYALYLFAAILLPLGLSLLIFIILAAVALSPCLTICYLISVHYEYRTIVAKRSFTPISKKQNNDKGNNDNVLDWLAGLDLGGRQKK